MRQLLKNNSGTAAAMVGVVVALLIAIIIGIMIWFKLSGPIVNSLNSGLPVAHAAVNTTVSGINTTATTIFTLFPIVAIVVIAGIILAVVTNFGSRPSA